MIVRGESPPKLITVERCHQCGYHRTRSEKEGDFVYKPTSACPKCKAKMEITAIFPETARKIPRKAVALILLSLTAFFFILTYTRLADVPYKYFDEADYTGGGLALAQLMIPSSQYTDPHPPLAKIIIGLGVLAFGQNPTGWRVSEAVAGTLMIPLLFLLGRRMFGPGLASIVAPFLLTLDFMHFVLAKLAILDGIFGLLTLLMQLAFYEYYRYARRYSYRHSTSRMIFAGITFGIAFAAKWPAAFSLLGFGAVFLYMTLKRVQRSRSEQKAWLKTALRTLIIALLCLILASFIYLLAWLPYIVGGWSVNLVLFWQTIMYQYHTALHHTFAYDSRFWSWPLMLTPIPLIYYYPKFFQVAEILMIGNPAIWWATYPILAVSLLQVIRKHDATLAYLLVAFLSSWLPFALVNRFQIIYYYYVSLPMLILIVSYWLQYASTRSIGKAAVAAYLAIVVALFTLFYPILTAQPVSQGLAESLRWLPSWGR